ncbi:MAG: amidohydrolase [Actinomycetota bacterium]
MSRFAVVADRVVGTADPQADSVVIEEGRIAAVTTRQELGDIPRREHPGTTIAPSFTDSHLHPVGYAALVGGTSLGEADSPDDLRRLLEEAASRLPPGQALMAQRLDDTRLGRMPTRQDLDEAVPEHPVIAYRHCGHVAVVNTAVLEMAGVSRTTADPPGGSLDRDGSGLPTGVLRETALDLVAPFLDPLVPPPDVGRVVQAINGLRGYGIGHAGAMVSSRHPLWCGVGDEIGLLSEAGPELEVDLDVMVIADSADELEQAARRLDVMGGGIRFWGWKGFADGSLGGHTASMWERYSDVDTLGTSRLDPARDEHLARTALDLGGVVAIHAIGDRAVDETLDLFDLLLQTGADPARLRLEHASVVSDEAIRRLASRGVVASVQPSFLTSEAGWVPERLGPARAAYRFRSMLRAGVEMIGGSDSPVERPDPLVGMAAAVERRGWVDDEHVTVEQALALYTSAPAHHFGRPEPLAPGSPADMNLVDGRPGEPGAEVAFVYAQGELRRHRPVPWPG